MKNNLIKILIDGFDDRLTSAIPSFKRCYSQSFPRPGSLYIEDSSKPTIFIYFQVNEKTEGGFTIGISWSEDGHRPPTLSIGSPRDWPNLGIKRQDIDGTNFSFRLGKLWAEPPSDVWWQLIPRTKLFRADKKNILADQNLDDQSKCDQLLDDVVEKIVTYGCPYISEIRSRYKV